jgi:hypothetical protein
MITEESAPENAEGTEDEPTEAMTDGELLEKETDPELLAAQPDTGLQAIYIGEWLEQCTITKCGPETARFLAERGRNVFQKYVAKLDALESAKDILAADTDNSSPHLRQRPWKLFETYMCVSSKNDRKRYKDALITLCGETVDTTERVKKAVSYINLCFRTVVRQWAAKEADGLRDSDGIRQAYTVSNTHNTEDTPEASIYDFIPETVAEFDLVEDSPLSDMESSSRDPASEASHSDLQTSAGLSRLIQHIADDVISHMNKAMRTALAARAYGISLAHPRLADFADRGSTQLSSYLQAPDKKNTKPSRFNIPAQISKAVEARLPPELADLRTYLMARTTECLLLDIKKWLMKPENSQLRCFLKDEGDH